MVVGLPLLGKLVVIELSKFFDSLTVAVIIFLELVSEITIFVDHSRHFRLSFLACSFEPVVTLLNFVLLLFDLVVESFDLSLVQIFEFVFVFPMLSYEIVLDVLVFCFDEIDLMGFLLF